MGLLVRAFSYAHKCVCMCVWRGRLCSCAHTSSTHSHSAHALCLHEAPLCKNMQMEALVPIMDPVEPHCLLALSRGLKPTDGPVTSSLEQLLPSVLSKYSDVFSGHSPFPLFAGGPMRNEHDTLASELTPSEKVLHAEGGAHPHYLSSGAEVEFSSTASGATSAGDVWTELDVCCDAALGTDRSALRWLFRNGTGGAGGSGLLDGGNEGGQRTSVPPKGRWCMPSIGAYLSDAMYKISSKLKGQNKNPYFCNCDKLVR